MIQDIFFVLLGFALLVKGGDCLVGGATAIARRARLSAMVIGVTVVGFGTSMPELLVSARAALAGSSGIALGNVAGSNIANIALILGLTALFRPLPATRSMLRADVPFMVAAAGLLTLAASGGTIERWMGALMIATLATFISWEIVRFRTAGARAGGSAGARAPLVIRHPDGNDTGDAAKILTENGADNAENRSASFTLSAENRSASSTRTEDNGVRVGPSVGCPDGNNAQPSSCPDGNNAQPSSCPDGNNGGRVGPRVGSSVGSSVDPPIWRALLLVGVSLVAMVWGADRLVAGATGLARALGEAAGADPAAMERVIGLTVVALGTSLPELFASVIAARKGETEMAVGNIVGSVSFNILCVVGVSSAIAPIGGAWEPFAADYAVMVGLCLLLWVFLYTGRTLSRWEGAALLAIYAAYTALVIKN